MVAFDTEGHRWFTSYTDDVAVLPMPPLSPQFVKFRVVPLDWFISELVVQDYEVGAGSDVFMVGRFIKYDGQQQNTPSVRFGNISMMPLEPIQHPDGHMQDSFVLDMRSLPGYSGSPIFVYTYTPIHTAFKWEEGQKGMWPGRGNVDPRHSPGERFSWLLGIDWGHGREGERNELVRNAREKPLIRNDVFRDGDDSRLNWKVRSNTGTTNVVPAWKLYDLLYREDVIMHRKKIDEEIAEELSDSPASLDVFDEEDTGETEDRREKGFNRQEFLDILRRVSRPDKPDSKRATNFSLAYLFCLYHPYQYWFHVLGLLVVDALLHYVAGGQVAAAVAFLCPYSYHQA